MYQIKTIQDKPEKLEMKMNKFLKDNPNIDIVDMRQTQSDSSVYVALTILYKLQ